MKEMGRQFVLGETIDKAMDRARELEGKGYTYSYDMLGEAARTEADALREHQLRLSAQLQRRSGDLILMLSTGPVSAMIAWCGDSAYSHAALMADGGDLEALPLKACIQDLALARITGSPRWTGIDRLVALMCDEPSIRDLRCEPSIPSSRQLHAGHLLGGQETTPQRCYQGGATQGMAGPVRRLARLLVHERGNQRQVVTGIGGNVVVLPGMVTRRQAVAAQVDGVDAMAGEVLGNRAPNPPVKAGGMGEHQRRRVRAARCGCPFVDHHIDVVHAVGAGQRFGTSVAHGAAQPDRARSVNRTNL